MNNDKLRERVEEANKRYGEPAFVSGNKKADDWPADIKLINDLFAALENREATIKRCYKMNCGRDYMHLPLPEAVAAVRDKDEAKLTIARKALEKLATCDMTMPLQDKMYAVDHIASEALKQIGEDDEH